VVPLEEATERLGRAWGIVNHLNHVADTPELRAVYNENQPKVTEFWTELARTKRCSTSTRRCAPARLRQPDAGAQAHRRERPARLPPRRRRAAGPTKRNASPRSRNSTPRCRRASRKTCSTRPTTTSCWSTDEADLAGLPDDVEAAAAPPPSATARPAGSSRCTSRPTSRCCSSPTNARCAKRSTAPAPPRPRKWAACSANWKSGTTPSNIATLLKLRDEEAKLLDYRNFAEVSLVPKMAESPARDRVPGRPGAPRPSVRRERPGRAARLRQGRAGHRRHAGLGRGLRLGKAARAALCLLGPGSEGILPRAEGRRRPVQAGAEPVLGEIKPDTAPVWHPDVRSTASSATASWSASSTSTCTRAPARARAPGWTTRAAAA
jgi:oligopeptidase A